MGPAVNLRGRTRSRTKSQGDLQGQARCRRCIEAGGNRTSSEVQKLSELGGSLSIQAVKIRKARETRVWYRLWVRKSQYYFISWSGAQC